MKTNVHILDSKIETSDSFEAKIAKIINDELNAYAYEDANIIVLESIGMKRTGHGQYMLTLDLDVDSFKTSLRRHSTSSLAYDIIHNDDSSEHLRSSTFKRIALLMLSDNVEGFVDDMVSENVVRKMKTTKQN